MARELVEFKKLPIVDIIGIIDFFQLSFERVYDLFGIQSSTVDTLRALTKEMKCAKSVVGNYSDYAEYVSGVKSFIKPVQPSRNKLDVAFKNVPTSFVNAHDFCEKYNVSVFALKQIKRFDPVPFKGTVKFKTVDGILMVGRFKNEQ